MSPEHQNETKKMILRKYVDKPNNGKIYRILYWYFIESVLKQFVSRLQGQSGWSGKLRLGNVPISEKKQQHTATLKCFFN